jgi:hypothetical protein
MQKRQELGNNFIPSNEAMNIRKCGAIWRKLKRNKSLFRLKKRIEMIKCGSVTLHAIHKFGERSPSLHIHHS